MAEGQIPGSRACPARRGGAQIRGDSYPFGVKFGFGELLCGSGRLSEHVRAQANLASVGLALRAGDLAVRPLIRTALVPSCPPRGVRRIDLELACQWR